MPQRKDYTSNHLQLNEQPDMQEMKQMHGFIH